MPSSATRGFSRASRAVADEDVYVPGRWWTDGRGHGGHLGHLQSSLIGGCNGVEGGIDHVATTGVREAGQARRRERARALPALRNLTNDGVQMDCSRVGPDRDVRGSIA